MYRSHSRIYSCSPALFESTQTGTAPSTEGCCVSGFGRGARCSESCWAEAAASLRSMRRLEILYASGDSPVGPALPESLGWRRNLHDALVGLGHNVREFRYDRMRETFANVDPTQPEQRDFITRNRPRLSEQLLAAAEEAIRVSSLDVLFTY